MSQGPTKLFKAAKEYNVSTTTIVETLESKGFSIDYKPNATITVEMLRALDDVYSIDREKNISFEKQRDDYHEMRNTIKSRQNQSISIDSALGLDPLDDLLPLEPIQNEPEFDLKPIETPKTEKVEPTVEPVIKPVESQKQEPKVVAPVVEPIEKAAIKETPVVTTTETSVKADTVKPQVAENVETKQEAPKTESTPPTVVEPISVKEERTVDSITVKSVKGEDKETKSESILVETPSEPVAEAPKRVSTMTDEELEAEIIRAKAEKLQGTKVLGKVELSSPFESTSEGKKPLLKKKDQRDTRDNRGGRDNRDRRDVKPGQNAPVTKEGVRPNREGGQTAGAGKDGRPNRENRDNRNPQSRDGQPRDGQTREAKPRLSEQRPAGSSSPEKLKVVPPTVEAIPDLGLDENGKPRKKRLTKRDPKELTKPGTATTTGSSTAAKAGKKGKGKGRNEGEEEEAEGKPRDTKLRANQSSSVANNKKRSKLRKKKREEMAAEREEAEALAELERSTTLEVAEFITASDLAELLNVSVTQIISSVFSIGIMISINQRLDASTIELIANQFGKEVKFITADELIDEEEEDDEDPSELVSRAPVVTIMGHVDHGKTSLLDYIRRTKVAAGEAGGITQHIGAYSVTLDDGRKITFLDTPGHEAFTAMRARGAQVTDIVILVVAADDSVMPQTVEAINHAQAAGVPIIVAINKIDKAEANPAKIKQQLTEYSVVVEEYGGSTQTAEVSAKQGIGIDELLEKVLIEAELLELKANPDRYAQGIILESRIDKGKGVVANVLVQNGTLDVGDVFLAGQFSGRVRAMENELGQRLKSVGPSTPIQLTGFDGLPQAGDKLIGMEDERKAKEIASQRQQIKREQSIRMVKHLTLDDLSRRIALGEVSDLNIIIKGDVDGSIEALAGTLQKLSTDEVKVKIIHTGVGAISESDVLLASASDAIIIGFQVRPTANAKKLAEQESIDVRLFSVIYDAIDEVKEAMEGLLSPEVKEKILGTADVRETFKVPNVGTVAGCYITDGKVVRNNKLRLIRDGIVVFNGEMGALRRFKDDVKEVATGYECGISIHNFNDIKVGDVIEVYENYEVKRKLNG